MKKEKLYLKPPVGRDVEDICLNCGRPVPPCRCGEAIEKLACSLHLNTPMRVIAIPSYQCRVRTGLREITQWTDAAECGVLGCGYMRALKDAQGVPRNQNVKTGRK